MKPAPIPADDNARVAKLEQFNLLDTLPEQSFDDLTALAAHIMGTPIALVSLVDRDRQWFKSRFGLDAPETPRDVSFCGHAVADRETLVVDDAFSDPRFADNPLVVGEPRVIYYAGAPLISSDGWALGTLCVIDHKPRETQPESLRMLEALSRQVMAQIELRLRVQQQVQELEDLHRLEDTKDAFISMVNHELRTPLTSITGALGLISGGAVGPVPDKVENLISVAKRNAERLAAIVNDILDLEKLSAGSMEFRMERANVGAVLQSVERLSGPFAVRHGVQLVASTTCPNTSLRGDSSRLQQVFDNLVSNAVKYSEKGSRVELSADLIGGTIRFSVRDHGPGIPESFRHHVFDRFSQAANSPTQFPSTGLGLAIAKSIVEAHGGRIGFETVLGEGTTFFFELPAALDASA